MAGKQRSFAVPAIEKHGRLIFQGRHRARVLAEEFYKNCLPDPRHRAHVRRATRRAVFRSRQYIQSCAGGSLWSMSELKKAIG
eukprot:2778594-Amphidinium_carterae.1